MPFMEQCVIRVIDTRLPNLHVYFEKIIIIYEQEIKNARAQTDVLTSSFFAVNDRCFFFCDSGIHIFKKSRDIMATNYFAVFFLKK